MARSTGAGDNDHRAGDSNVSRIPTAEEDANWSPYGNDRSRALTSKEVAAINNGTYEDGAADITAPEQRTELANARRFIDKYGDKLRFCPQWGKWLIWDGRRWAIDDGCQVEALYRGVVEEVWAGVQGSLREVERSEAVSMVSFAKATASDRGMQCCLHLARSEPGIPIQPSELDKNEWLLNVENGTLDLRTGELRPHDKRDHITKLAPVLFTKNRTSETWEKFVAEIMAGDAELIGFLQRLCGYWLTGSVRDHVLPIFCGTGANGKSVFLGTIEAMLGTDYAMHAPPDLLMVKRHESHPTERADLFGKRLVTCIETESGRRLAESLVKELTGADKVRARRMREDFWEFTPSHKIVMAVNHRPIVYGTDHGLWRRLREVPFAVTIAPEQQDKTLPERLRKELHGVLTWCVRGCMEWQARGLAEPASVLTATDAYREGQDILADFFEACCIIEPDAKVSAGPLYQAYVDWCKANGHDADNSTVFGRKLTERGYPSKKNSAGSKVRYGIGLLHAPNDF
jgi:putative DNA primase/helicase